MSQLTQEQIALFKFDTEQTSYINTLLSLAHSDGKLEVYRELLK